MVRGEWLPRNQSHNPHSIPPFLRHCAQSMLSAQWTRRIPLVQKQPPAHLAAVLLQHHLSILDTWPPSSRHHATGPPLPLQVVDFCSGAGGPTPCIEKSLNTLRRSKQLPSIPFLLTDLHPHIDAWMELAEHSANLSFIPQSVDAMAPPPSVVSCGSSSNSDYSSEARVFRTYFLSFHHFDDDMAVRALRSTLATSDGFAIVELQDRRVSSVVLMLLEYWLLFLVTVFWFGDDAWHVVFTYCIPVLPALMAWDGFVSALRTRTFDEVMELVDVAMGRKKAWNGIGRPMAWFSVDGGDRRKYVEKGGWVFEGGRQMHTFPFGHMNWTIGRKKPRD